MYCSQCGAQILGDAKFCMTCGASIRSPLSPSLAASAQAPVGERRRPPVVTLLSVLKFICGSAFVFLGLVVAVTGHSQEPAVALPLSVGFLVFGGLALACGFGLWRLEPFGRYLQIAFSALGLFGFPFQTLISILILIYMFKPGIRVVFSGTPVQELSANELEQLRLLQSQNVAVIVIAVVAGVLLFVSMTGVIAAIAIPNFLNAVDRGKQKRTMIDMRSIGVAIESYAVDKNIYPKVTSAAALRGEIEPLYIKVMPSADGWGNPFQVDASGLDYTVYSQGKDGTGSNCASGTTTRFSEEICFVNGQFVRYPAGSQQ